MMQYGICGIASSRGYPLQREPGGHATAGANDSVGAAVPVQNIVVDPSASFCVGIAGNSRVYGFLARDN